MHRQGRETMASYYKQINNVKYDRQLLALADKLQSGRGDGRISAKDAKQISREVYDASTRTPTEDKTVRKIYREANFTDAGRDAFETSNRSSGARIGWRTRRANESKTPAQSATQSATQSVTQSAGASQVAARIAQKG